MGIIDELMIGLGFKYDDKGIDKFKKDINETVNAVKNLAKIAVAGAAAITALTIASTKASDELGKLADEIGEDVESIDALQFALERSGGSAGGMSNALRNLAMRASEAARGVGSGVEVFGLLDVSVIQSNGNLKAASQLMLDIAARFKNIGNSQQIEFAEKLGIKDAIRLLQKEKSEIKSLVNEASALGVVTKKDAAIAADFQDSMTDFWKVTKQISRLLSREFAPIIKKITDVFLSWWRHNRELIEQNLPGWIDGVITSIKLLVVAVGAWLSLRLATHIITLIAAFRGLSVAALAANAAVMLLPTLIVAGVAALALLAEDAKRFFEGGESFIGDMIAKFPEFKTELTAIAALFAGMAEFVIMIYDGWVNIFKIAKNFSIAGFKQFGKNLDGMVGDLTGLYKIDGTGLIPDFKNAASNVVSTAIDKIEILIQGGADPAGTIASAVFDKLQQNFNDLSTAVDQ